MFPLALGGLEIKGRLRLLPENFGEIRLSGDFDRRLGDRLLRKNLFWIPLLGDFERVRFRAICEIPLRGGERLLDRLGRGECPGENDDRRRDLSNALLFSATNLRKGETLSFTFV